MASRPLILKCPSCNGDLAVTKLRCQPCDITLDGDFSIPALLRLNRSQLDFVEVFLKNRGIIREVERELGVSYPTVRARLDEVLDAIGYQDGGRSTRETSDDAATRNRRAILEQLSAGKISAEDAMRALGALQVRNPQKSEREEPQREESEDE